MKSARILSVLALSVAAAGVAMPAARAEPTPRACGYVAAASTTTASRTRT